ncbi:MAG: polymer-forming cytoskeletal protein [Methyloligellaceae bacterium]
MSIFGSPSQKEDSKTSGEESTEQQSSSTLSKPVSSLKPQSPASRSTRQSPSTGNGKTLIREDMSIRGELHGGQSIDVFGYVEGTVSAGSIQIHESGQLYGTLVSDNATISGTVQGDIRVKHLINILSTGAVTGDIEYGQLALESGGELSAELRNVPPTLSGDHEVNVAFGGSVTITAEDINALDPDNDASELTFEVSNIRNGFVSKSNAPDVSVTNFTQAEIEANQVLFVHDGKSRSGTQFDVFVRDASGATSGDPQTVAVVVE